ncbi:hypothetical protein AB0P15_28715 [Streptomyces sp. NPDC087917]|uniref:hypothetical protein n=1 Tax=Streptomyces sp. NPDC087917 TaxID=3155060 RepID=UPI003441ABD0
MRTHPKGHPEPTTVPAEQRVRTCRAATAVPPAQDTKGADSRPEVVVRGED